MFTVGYPSKYMVKVNHSRRRESRELTREAQDASRGSNHWRCPEHTSQYHERARAPLSCIISPLLDHQRRGARYALKSEDVEVTAAYRCQQS